VARQENAELVGEFVDKASADDLRGRREWRRLLELTQARKVDLIVVWRLDRAFRSVLDGAQTLKQLRTWDCGIRSLQEPWIDTTTPFGEALFYITVAWAQLEKQTLAQRVQAGMSGLERRASTWAGRRVLRRSLNTGSGIGSSPASRGAT
jgi:DNA invertase Pin-like site-specific DNA recombinase